MFQPMNLVKNFGFGIEQSRNLIAELISVSAFLHVSLTPGDVHSLAVG